MRSRRLIFMVEHSTKDYVYDILGCVYSPYGGISFIEFGDGDQMVFATVLVEEYY